MSPDELAQKITNCNNCSLAKSRRNAVVGEGDINSDILFIGEAPGENEDKLGRPFVGPAGELLTKMLHKNNLDRSLIYITNVVKCRPQFNRDPLPDEVQACAFWLNEQLKLIQPKIIVTLGRHALEKFLPGIGRISQVHGRLFKKGNYYVLPFYHPAACLHQISLLSEFEEDFEKLNDILNSINN
ncbi:MAG: uracil-DNA glycosylase [Patescibacteria group bacterium]|jgi:DNA polymerase